MEGRSEVADGRSELVRLAARLIIEEALEGEARDAVGRDYYARGARPGGGYRNGYRPGRVNSAEGAIEYSAPQIADRSAPFRSRIREVVRGRTEELETLAVEMYARGLSTRDIEAVFADTDGRSMLSRSAVSEKVDEASAASWNEILSVNLMGYVFCAKAAVPLMRGNKGGAFVNVASVRSVVAGGGNLQYDTTKAAVAGLTRALAADHSPDGIRVNAVGPGPIFTPFHQRRIAAAGETVEQYNAKAAQGTMLKRPGRAEEVAAAILFLASDDASYVTGALLFVDGGMTAL
jgi:NAD(P)-dependent dehydrogenase (short-subunit alcohol dehydrogenase family)